MIRRKRHLKFFSIQLRMARQVRRTRSGKCILHCHALVLALSLFIVRMASAQTGAGWTSGSVLDPSGLPIVGASIAFDSIQGTHLTAATGRDGTFTVHLPATGAYTVRVEAAGFASVIRTMQIEVGTADLLLRLQNVAATDQDIVVAADVSRIEIASPDPSQKVLVRGGTARRQPWTPWRADLHSRAAH